MFKPLAIVILGAIVFMAPAILNGVPFLYFDSIDYLSRAETSVDFLLRRLGVDIAPLSGNVFPDIHLDGTQTNAERQAANVMAGRSVYYGLLAYGGYVTGKLWPLVCLQALIMSWLTWLCGRKLLPSWSGKTHLLGSAILAVLTPAGLFVGLVMPDIWAGFALLSLALLLFFWTGLGGWTRVALVAIVTAAMLFHNSHVALVAVMLALAVLWRIGAPGRTTRPARRAMVLALGGLLVALIGNASFGYLVERGSGRQMVSRPFITAHLIDAGPGTVHARAACASDPESYALCAYADRLPMEWRLFMFDPDRATGAFGAADPQTQRAISDEQLRFALGTLRHDPTAFVKSMVGDGLRQLVMLRIDEIPATNRRDEHHFKRLPAWLEQAARDSLIYGRRDLLLALNVSIYASAALACVILGAALIGGPRRAATGLDRSACHAIGFIVAGVAINAVICGVLASPYDRFQARVVWILTFAAFVLAMALLERRQVRLSLKSEYS